MQVGFRTGISFDTSRSNWDGTGHRPLVWTAWYPTDEDSSAAIPDERSWFKKELVVANATALRSDQPLRLVILSHGTGATAAALEWLGFRLAQRGFVALAVNHHGHTGSESYRAEGFLCLWERAGDLSAILDDRSWRSEIGVEIEEMASVAGFSAGAYTALLLVGARVAFSQFEPDNPVKSPIRGPREFPNLADELPKLHQNPVFHVAWERRHADFSDRRVQQAIAIAPGRSVLGFSQESLRGIRKPTQIFGGDEDTVAPPSDCCGWLHENIPGCVYEILSGGVGHYTFLPEGSEVGRGASPELFVDRQGLERTKIHDYVAQRCVHFFAGRTPGLTSDQSATKLFAAPYLRKTDTISDTEAPENRSAKHIWISFASAAGACIAAGAAVILLIQSERLNAETAFLQFTQHRVSTCIAIAQHHFAMLDSDRTIALDGEKQIGGDEEIDLVIDGKIVDDAGQPIRMSKNRERGNKAIGLARQLALCTSSDTEKTRDCIQEIVENNTNWLVNDDEVGQGDEPRKGSRNPAC